MMEEAKKGQDLSPEKRKELADKVKARAIVKEILDFGVTDNQIRETMKMLALELEDREVMLKIFEFLGDTKEEVPQETKIYT
jgi:hypothetical protein